MAQTKTKSTQKKNAEVSNERDCFLTPSFATKILLPYIPKHIKTIWECSSGEGNMSKVFENANYNVLKTDLRENKELGIEQWNFLVGVPLKWNPVWDNLKKELAIVTNPPFSLKKEFWETCFYHNIPFALLIPSDICGWVLRAFEAGAQVIVPNRRIDYLTPNIIKNINYVLNLSNNDLTDAQKKKRGNLYKMGIPMNTIYKTLEEIPIPVIRMFSSSDFHSWWLTYGFNLPQQINVVDLSNEMKNDIF